MIEYIVHKICHDIKGDHQYHTLLMPELKDPGFYRQRLSFNAFFYGMKLRSKSHTHLYVARLMTEHIQMTNALIHYLPEADRIPYQQKAIPIITHGDIWSFYLHEGYDYKKNRWIKNHKGVYPSG